MNGQNVPMATGAYSAITDANGEFTIDDVQLGEYVLTVERSGFVQSGATFRRISVQLGKSQDDLVFHMLPAAVITGKIVDVDGDAMSDVFVSASRARSGWNSHEFGSVTTNDLGEFRIPNLRAGRYEIAASPPPGSRPPDLKVNPDGKNQSIYQTTYYPGVLDEDRAVLVDVHPGAETRINFALLTGRAYRVSGSVTGVPNKGSTAQIILQAKEHSGSQNTQQELGEDGKFEFSNVLPGSYVATMMIVTIEGGQPAPLMLRLSQSIEVSNANVEGLRLQPQATGQVQGKFRIDADQKFDWTQLSVTLLPVEERGGNIIWPGAIGPPTSSSLNMDGSFELKNVPGGNYQLLVGARSNNLADYFTKSVTLDGQDVADSGFQVFSQTYLDVEISAKGASITGEVVDGNGQPVANATVVDVPAAERRTRPDLYQRDMTDESGHFSLRGLNPGKYTVFAFEELQSDVRQPEFLTTYETLGEPVELDEGARKNVVLKLIPYDSEAQ
jgi:protocatechuate 3,4-dioxygenase beta subunit